MLKLIIADDERVIRETLSNMVDWKQLGIELVGLCKDGIEAYNMILDEAPDIVMTDIRMPGLSGLELARKVTQTDQQIQFIFLSGYGEFDYAREAMEYGVRYYLLKPCSEGKLIESIKQASRDCIKIKKQMEERIYQNEMLRIVKQDTIYHLIMDGMFLENTGKGELRSKLRLMLENYGRGQEFIGLPCYLYYVYFLEREYLEEFLERLKEYTREQKESFIFYGIYVKNTLLLFSHEPNQNRVLKSCVQRENSIVEVAEEKYDDFSELLETVLLKVKRYDMVYPIHDFRVMAIANNQNTMRYLQNLYRQLESNEKELKNVSIKELLAMVREVSQLESLQMLGSSICMQFVHMGVCSVLDMTSFISAIGAEKSIEGLRVQIEKMVLQFADSVEEDTREYGRITERVITYIDEHLSDAELTLKKIAEEHLYMNVEYVSRQFRKATGKKFSQYLAEQRIRRAKELLIKEDCSKIQYVAECVGCGNNPQYFSQIFKKIEGMTPGKWVAQARGKSS